ncbi:hypothetical protein GQ457_07G022380 [Hibiscus cannabinus]
MAVLFKGNKVEVCSKEEFFGSIRTWLKKTVSAGNEVRPMPPLITVKEATRIFNHLERVDAFDNDGWWVGTITGKQGLILKLRNPAFMAFNILSIIRFHVLEKQAKALHELATCILESGLRRMIKEFVVL